MAILGNIALLAVSTILMVVPFAAVVNATIEDPDVDRTNWHEVAAGKRVLIKYFEPYCEFNIASLREFPSIVWWHVLWYKNGFACQSESALLYYSVYVFIFLLFCFVADSAIQKQFGVPLRFHSMLFFSFYQ